MDNAGRIDERCFVNPDKGGQALFKIRQWLGQQSPFAVPKMKPGIVIRTNEVGKKRRVFKKLADELHGNVEFKRLV